MEAVLRRVDRYLDTLNAGLPEDMFSKYIDVAVNEYGG